MPFLALSKMWQRIEVARQDSDTALFFDLLYAGEMLLKIVTAGLVAAVSDDCERHRYRQLHQLVRADSPGGWTSVIEEILFGPTSHLLVSPARDEQRELTQKVGPGGWQYDSLKQLNAVFKSLDPKREDIATKVDGRTWFLSFAELRNTTRGHGAPGSGLCGQLCSDLEKSIRLVVDSFKLFQRPWAYLHRNLSGKYRVIGLTNDSSPFDYLKTTSTVNLSDGVYVYFGTPSRVDLIDANVDVADFYFPNGNFTGKKYELISYITGNKKDADASSYLAPPGALPSSETQGIGTLEVQGKLITNLPPSPSGYVKRAELEKELFAALINDRHPIITIRGGGGIGKTSTALKVLHDAAETERFLVIIWFSARDIDLLPEGPKSVRPHVLTDKDIAEEYSRLTEPAGALDKGKKFDSIAHMASCMSQSPFGGSILFVFDNFETVRNPLDLFAWLDANIRNPNKILITTRKGDFKADYWIEVGGMTETEADELTNSTADRLGVRDLLTNDYRRELYQEADGHPYIIKVLLGEVAKANKLVITGSDKLIAFRRHSGRFHA